jgi:hypothetical protein
MTLTKRESGQLLLEPEPNEDLVLHCSTRPPPRTRGESSVVDTNPSWLTGGNLQALRPTGMSLCRNRRPWPQALSIGQHDQEAVAIQLRAQRRLPRNRRVYHQFPYGARCFKRDLRHQHRTLAPSRGSGIAHGRTTPSGYRRTRLCPGGSDSCQYDRMLYCRRPAIRFGGGQSS